MTFINERDSLLTTSQNAKWSKNLVDKFGFQMTASDAKVVMIL